MKTFKHMVKGLNILKDFMISDHNMEEITLKIKEVQAYLDTYFVRESVPPGIQKIEAPQFRRINGKAGMYLSGIKSGHRDILLARLEREIKKEEVSQNFYSKLCEHIDRRGYKSDAEFYKAAGISRQVFSRLRNANNALPSKHNIIAMAVELRLSESEALELLNLAGYTFQSNKKRDVIIRFFFKEQQFDHFMIDSTLDHFGEEPLFSQL